MAWYPTPGEQAVAQRYLWRDLSKRLLQRWLWHLERLQLSRGYNLGGWSQVWRQMRGNWLGSAHGLWGQDLWQGRWLGHWNRLEGKKKRSLVLRHRRNPVLLEHACTCLYMHALAHLHIHSHIHTKSHMLRHITYIYTPA